MTNKLISAVMIVLVVASGCSMSAPSHTIGTVMQNHSTEDGTFSASMSVYASQASGDPVTWHDVSLVLYDENRTVIKRVHVGTISLEDGPANRTVNFTAGEVPKYIVVTSPDFWEHGELTVDSWVRHDGRWWRYAQEGPDRTFPDDDEL